MFEGASTWVPGQWTLTGEEGVPWTRGLRRGSRWLTLEGGLQWKATLWEEEVCSRWGGVFASQSRGSCLIPPTLHKAARIVLKKKRNPITI